MLAFALASGTALTQIGGMIEIEDIKDEASLKEWLTKWPKANGLDKDTARAVAVSIAHRAAMRVLPRWWAWSLTKDARKLDLTALPILHCSLISGVAGKMLTPEITAATYATNAAATAAAAAVAIVKDDAADASEAAYAAVYATTAAISITEAAAAATIHATTHANTNVVVADTAAAYAAGWKTLRSDCEIYSNRQDVFAMPLWLNQKNPFEKVWHEVTNNETGPEWAFWIKWYNDALEGRPQNWKMLEQIALIDPEVWEAGAEAVAERIGEIELEYADATGLSETNLIPEQALAKNAKVVLLQLDALKFFVEEEIQTLRAPNDISKEVMARIVLLEGILASVVEIQLALNDNNSSCQDALAIVEKQLPKVIEAADELADKSGTTEVSETIILMGATIEHLTKRGAPGYMATGIAATEVILSTIKKWFERCKSTKDRGG